MKKLTVVSILAVNLNTVEFKRWEFKTVVTPVVIYQTASFNEDELFLKIRVNCISIYNDYPGIIERIEEAESVIKIQEIMKDVEQDTEKTILDIRTYEFPE